MGRSYSKVKFWTGLEVIAMMFLFHRITFSSPASKFAVEPPCFFFLLRSSLLGFKVNLLICLFVSCTQCCLLLLIPLNAGLVIKPGADKTCYLLCTEKAKCVFLIAEKRNLSVVRLS